MPYKSSDNDPRAVTAWKYKGFLIIRNRESKLWEVYATSRNRKQLMLLGEEPSYLGARALVDKSGVLSLF